MPTARTGVSAVELNGQIYVMGGLDASGNVLDVVEVYNPEVNTWSLVENMRTPRFNAAAAAIDGQIYIMGGVDETRTPLKKVETFIPAENDWDSFDNLNEEREGLAAVVVDDELYVLGGSGENARILDSVEYLDVEEEKWEVSNNWTLDVPRALFATAAVDDIAYAIGGFSSFGPVGLVQQYDRDEGSSTLESLMPGRGGLAAVELDEIIYALGGRQSNDEVVNTVNRFSPEENRWEQAPGMRVARDRFAAVSYNDRIFVFGGTTTTGEVLNSVEAFEVLILPEPDKDFLVVEEDTEMSINVLLNDVDPAGGSLSVVSFSQPMYGEVVQLNASTFTYTPEKDFFGEDTFQYTVQNDLGGTAQERVQVTVTPVNDDPIFATTPTLVAIVDSLYSYRIIGTDPDDDPLSIEVVELPGWLFANTLQGGEALLEGTPSIPELGEHTVLVRITDGFVSVDQQFTLEVAQGEPDQLMLLLPVNGAEGLEMNPTLEWSASGAASFELEVAEDSLFSRLVTQEASLTNPVFVINGLMPNTMYYWRVRALNGAGTTQWTAPFTFRTARDTGVEKEEIPRGVTLISNYPNPFRSSTTFKYEINAPLDGSLVLTVFDVHGREVSALKSYINAPGLYHVQWEAVDFAGRLLSSGTYIAVLSYGEEQHTRLITLVR